MNPIMTRPRSEVTDIWCKRVDRALKRLSSANIVLAVRGNRDDKRNTDISIIRYELPEASRELSTTKNIKKSRLSLTPEGWAVPISYNSSPIDINALGVRWRLDMSVVADDFVRCTYRYGVFNGADAPPTNILISDTDCDIFDDLQRRVLSCAHFELSEDTEVHSVFTENPDTLPVLLAQPGITATRVSDIIKDYLRVVITKKRTTVDVRI